VVGRDVWMFLQEGGRETVDYRRKAEDRRPQTGDRRLKTEDFGKDAGGKLKAEGEREGGEISRIHRGMSNEQGERKGGVYTLIFSDPPYDRSGEAGQLERLLTALEQRELLALGGVLVYEQDAKEKVLTDRAGWGLLRDRAYGKSRVLMYRKDG
ncbi:MAG: RsmD family RNA methyltransferase, partial [Kiritimatiellae bacterium]|nr:RsmD family RNA methyltransferase [Kiritimatiellia bacterium]